MAVIWLTPKSTRDPVKGLLNVDRKMNFRGVFPLPR
jgi:hypothetical protein